LRVTICERLWYMYDVSTNLALMRRKSLMEEL